MLHGGLLAETTIRVDDSRGVFGGTAEVPVVMNTTDEIQGFVLSLEWEDGLVGLSFDPGEALDSLEDEAQADVIVTRIDDAFGVMGVVMDADPADNGGAAEVIGAGNNIEIGLLSLACETPEDDATTETVSLVSFVDNKYASAEGGPLLRNLVVIGGFSKIDGEDGVSFLDGQVTCTVQPDELIIEETSLTNGRNCGEDDVVGVATPVRILMSNRREVEGFVVALCHNPDGATLSDISIGSDAVQADFSALELEEGGGALGVIIDLFDPQLSPPNIPAGQRNHIATAVYTCNVAEGAVSADIDFCDGVIGDPLKTNLIVVNGQSQTQGDGTLELINEGVTCGGAVEFPCEVCDDGIDNDFDGLVDGDDPDCPSLGEFMFEVLDDEGSRTADPTKVPVGGKSEVVLGLNSPSYLELGIDNDFPRQLVGVQGFSLGYEFDCSQIFAEESFDITGTILEEIGAEFVEVQVDNDPAEVDGDGCSLILAVLVDAAPPFDNRVIPGLEEQPLGRLCIGVREGVVCGTNVELVARDGVNGRGVVPLRNLVSVANFPYRASVQPIVLNAMNEERFFRGDCNFNFGVGAVEPVEIADAAAVVSFLFLDSVAAFDPPCLDACDANDDGRIDLADTIAILNYLFISGSRFPPAPGPGLDQDLNPTGPGRDPTEDPLDCVAGAACDL
ncbi:MAG: hypothetical protein AAF517_11405 [Planctomycetota bacterium]